MLVPFSPKAGLNSDDTTFSAAGTWADGSNVRFFEGKPQTIAGWALLTSSVGSVVSIYGFMNDSAFSIAYGGTATLYSSDGGNITPAGLGTGIASWSMSTFGNILLAAPNAGKLYKWDPAIDLLASQVATAPAKNTCILVTPERQVLSFGCNEEISTTFNPRCIRGSDLESYTNWTTSATNNAFEHILDGQGVIVTARQIGPYVAVWASTALYLGQFIGDPSQTYRFDIVSSIGAIGPDAVCVVGQTAYWIDPALNLYAWTAGSEPVAIACPISKDFKDNLNKTYRAKIIVSPNHRFSEIWIYYCDTRDGGTVNSRYIAFTPLEGTWSRGSMARTAVVTSNAVDGYLASGNYTPGSFLTANGTSVYVQEYGNTAAGSALNWFIQSADQYLDNAQRRTMILSVSPDFKDQVGDVSLTLYVRDRPQSTAVTKGPYTLTTSATKKDFRASGMIVSVKFSGGAASGSYARLGKPVFRCVECGGR